MRILLLSLGAFMLAALPAAAQSNCRVNGRNGSCSTTGTLSITIGIGRAVQLDLSAVSTTLAPPTAADFNIGYAATPGPSGTIRSNAPWSLAISAASPTWTATNTQTEPARTNKPASDLLVALSATGPFASLTTTPVTVASGNATSGQSYNLFYRTAYDWALDTPGNYSIQLVFTLVAP